MDATSRRLIHIADDESEVEGASEERINSRLTSPLDQPLLVRITGLR